MSVSIIVMATANLLARGGGTLLTRLLDWDNWQSAALDDVQARINALNCNRLKLNDNIYLLAAGLDVDPTPLISYQLTP